MKAKRTIWHRGQFDTEDNLTPSCKIGQFDTIMQNRTIWHREKFSPTVLKKVVIGQQCQDNLGQIVLGVKLSSLHGRCQIVLFCMMVSNCPRCQIVLGVKLSSLHGRCQIVLGVKLSSVSNCPITLTSPSSPSLSLSSLLTLSSIHPGRQYHHLSSPSVAIIFVTRLLADQSNLHVDDGCYLMCNDG